MTDKKNLKYILEQIKFYYFEVNGIQIFDLAV